MSDEHANGTIWCAMPSGATVGLVVRHNRVVDCAPYAKRWWAKGRDARALWRKLAAAGAELVWLPERE